MAVTFAPMNTDGTLYLDGVHDYTVQNNNTAQQYINTMAAQWAITWPAEPPMQTTIPGQVSGVLLYQVVQDYIAANTAGWSQATSDIWDRIKRAVAAGYRMPSRTIAWQ